MTVLTITENFFSYFLPIHYKFTSLNEQSGLSTSHSVSYSFYIPKLCIIYNYLIRHNALKKSVTPLLKLQYLFQISPRINAYVFMSCVQSLNFFNLTSPRHCIKSINLYFHQLNYLIKNLRVFSNMENWLQINCRKNSQITVNYYITI